MENLKHEQAESRELCVNKMIRSETEQTTTQNCHKGGEGKSLIK